MVLTLFSLLLTLSITRPLNRLRRAVHDLGQTAYQKDSLARLARRGDELGTLARDFNRMGERLQSLIGSQRQLLRDVSHELRSPLARLRIALALAERAEPEARAQMWPRPGTGMRPPGSADRRDPRPSPGSTPNPARANGSPCYRCSSGCAKTPCCWLRNRISAWRWRLT